MIPSIYSHSKQDSKDHFKGSKRSRFKVTALVCGLAAVMAFLVTLTVFFHGNMHHVKRTKDVVTFVRKHPKNTATALSHQDVFISVKTTHKNHQSRLEPVISTWYQMARDHTYFFTDRHDPITEAKVNSGHLVVTQCGDSHSRQDLCCKMSAEFDAFLESNKK